MGSTSTEIEICYHPPIKYFNFCLGDWRDGVRVERLKYDSIALPSTIKELQILFIPVKKAAFSN